LAGRNHAPRAQDAAAAVEREAPLQPLRAAENHDDTEADHARHERSGSGTQLAALKQGLIAERRAAIMDVAAHNIHQPMIISQ